MYSKTDLILTDERLIKITGGTWLKILIKLFAESIINFYFKNGKISNIFNWETLFDSKLLNKYQVSALKQRYFLFLIGYLGFLTIRFQQALIIHGASLTLALAV